MENRALRCECGWEGTGGTLRRYPRRPAACPVCKRNDKLHVVHAPAAEPPAQSLPTPDARRVLQGWLLFTQSGGWGPEQEAEWMALGLGEMCTSKALGDATRAVLAGVSVAPPPRSELARAYCAAIDAEQDNPCEGAEQAKEAAFRAWYAAGMPL